MKQRIAYYQASPEAMQALMALEVAVSRCGLASHLLTLAKLRASPINRCVFCLDIEAAEARRGGESSQRLAALTVRRDRMLFSARECAVLAWTEALTTLDNGHAPCAALDELRQQFNDRKIGNLTLAIAAINCWTRMGAGFRRPLS